LNNFNKKLLMIKLKTNKHRLKLSRLAYMLVMVVLLSSCGAKRDIIDLSPEYNPEKLIVPPLHAREG